jgi:hypothetical protein
MRRLSLIALSLVALAAMFASTSTAAKPGKGAKASKPQITRVTPMRLGIGQTLVIRGKNFKPRKKRNTVIFRAGDGRTAFVKPRRASRKKLVLKVPASVARLLTVRDSAQQPTRLKLRVLAGKFSRFTPRRLSPVLTGIRLGEDGRPLPICKSSEDHDGDLIANVDELTYKTDPCLKDTDGDGLTDGWEFFSARDLNRKAVPYPDKRPFPNPLDPADATVDFDGDGLQAVEEFRAWRHTGSSFVAAMIGSTGFESPLGYSDGTKFSRADETPAIPAWSSAAYGLVPPGEPFPETYNFHATLIDPDPEWRDDERDADADGLSNWIESARGPGKAAWWTAYWSQEQFSDLEIGPWPDTLPGCDQTPTAYSERPFADLDLSDADVDGDGLLDGEDDQDNDDYSNIKELFEVAYDDGQTVCGLPDLASVDRGGEPWAVNAFNPCAPDPDSRTCPRFGPPR